MLKLPTLDTAVNTIVVNYELQTYNDNVPNYTVTDTEKSFNWPLTCCSNDEMCITFLN